MPTHKKNSKGIEKYKHVMLPADTAQTYKMKLVFSTVPMFRYQLTL
jgi:hypothetical protein